MQDYRHLTLSQIGTLGSIGSLGNAFLAIVLGTINARIGFLAGQLAVLLASVIIWKGTGLPWYMLGYFFLGGFRVCKSLSMALARPLIHVSQMGIAYGFIETVSSIAIIIAPPIAGLIYQHEPEMIFIVSGVTITFIFLGSLKLIPRELKSTDEIMITPERE
jgi:MFS family permease